MMNVILKLLTKSNSSSKKKVIQQMKCMRVNFDCQLPVIEINTVYL